MEFLSCCEYSYLCVIITVDLLSHLRHLELLGHWVHYFLVGLEVHLQDFSLAVDRQLLVSCFGQI